ncbi:MAG: ABC transporter ATP-binding protein [Acidimicrobiales bacterium]
MNDGASLGPRSPFEPVGVTAGYAPPRAWIHPDQRRSWLGRLRPVVATHAWLLGIGLATAAVAMVIQVAIPAVSRFAIDDALVARTDALAPFVWVLLGLAVGRGALTFVFRYALYRMAYELEFDLRNILFEHLSRLPFGFYDRVQSGQIISRANSDIRSVQMFLAFAPLMAMSLLSFVIALGYMLSIHVLLTVVAVVALPGVYLVGVRLRELIFPLTWITQARVAEVATIVDENLTGVRVVKGFAAESRQIAELARAARRLRWSAVRQVDARARYGPIMENIPRLGLALVLLYGGLLAIDGRITVGTLFAFNSYVLMLQVPFRLLGFFLMMGQRARASAARIFEILDEPVTIADRPGAVDLVEPRGEVEFADVEFAYSPEAPAVLDGFSLRIEPGETVAIVGATGSGKSTIARLLARFYEPTAGVVRVDGRDVRDLTLVSLRAAVGIVLDEPFLFSMSIRDNIAYARPDATDDEIDAAAADAQAAGFVRALPEGYGTAVGERGYTLSGGQRQRLAIARTLVADPPILVLDDATSAIDVEIETAIHAALRRRRAGRTTLLIAHRLSTIAQADRVVLLDGGRVVAEGTHAHLLATEPLYAALTAFFVDEPSSGDVASTKNEEEGAA